MPPAPSGPHALRACSLRKRLSAAWNSRDTGKSGDEKCTTYAYHRNPANNIVTLPKRTTTKRAKTVGSSFGGGSFDGSGFGGGPTA